MNIRFGKKLLCLLLSVVLLCTCLAGCGSSGESGSADAQNMQPGNSAANTSVTDGAKIDSVVWSMVGDSTIEYEFVYNDKGLVQEIRRWFNGEEAENYEFSYDSQGRMVRSLFGGYENQYFIYSEEGLVSSKTDVYGNPFCEVYQYDDNGKLVSSVETSEFSERTKTWTDNGNIISFQSRDEWMGEDAETLTTSYAYDAKGNVAIKKTEAYGSTTTTVYDWESYQPFVGVVDDYGVSNLILTDSAGQVVWYLYPGNVMAGTMECLYDSQGRVTRVDAEYGDSWRIAYLN